MSHLVAVKPSMEPRHVLRVSDSATEGSGEALAGSVDTPDGPFTVIVGGDGAVLASGWTADAEYLRALIHPSLRPATVREVESERGASSLATCGLTRALAAVSAYYEGDHLAPSRVRVNQHSGPFRVHAWDVLRRVAPWQTVTYTQYARLAGRPLAVRAAASACATNAAALFVPCHRILRSDGSLGGFRYGLPIKESLLARESAAYHAEPVAA